MLDIKHKDKQSRNHENPANTLTLTSSCRSPHKVRRKIMLLLIPGTVCVCTVFSVYKLTKSDIKVIHSLSRPPFSIRLN